MFDIFLSDIYGTRGNIDGFQSDGFIYGWAAKINNKEIVNIWMQCQGIEPKKIICNKNRYDLTQIDIKENSGFQIDPASLEKIWDLKKVTFSFDREGKFSVPQIKDIIIPKSEILEKNIELVSQSESSENSIMELNNIPLDIQEKMNRIKDLSEKLSLFEREITKNDYFEKYRKKNLFSKILRILGKR